MMTATANKNSDTNPEMVAVTGLMNELLSEHTGRAAVAAREHVASGGSKLRAKLALHSARTLGLDLRIAIGIAAASELIHNASLVHDDIQDHSELRRGDSALWVRHGTDIAICSGDLLISAAYAALVTTGGAFLPAAIARMHKRVAEVIAGQCADLAAKNEATITLFGYKQIAAAKSAPLLGLPIELSLILAGRGDCIALAEQAANEFAVAYQMADDIEDAAVDIANGEVNIVGILSRELPFDAAVSLACSLAAKTFRLASDLASNLPSESGALMASIAANHALPLQNRNGSA
jgi:geranylgeranyl pyrophosphate synthase